MSFLQAERARSGARTPDLLLKVNGYESERYDFFITIKNSEAENLSKELSLIGGKAAPTVSQLLDLVDDKFHEKYDYLLGLDLLTEEFGRKNLSLDGALEYLKCK